MRVILLSLPVILGSCAWARPVPSPALQTRINEGIELYGIVHFSINTFTDREWGYGNESPSLFAPTSFDAEQIVKASKAGGLQGLIVVAKHHDGFCLWQTRTTSHSVAASPFRDGKGDYVKEMRLACEKYGLRFGVYVSPWDRNSAIYGSDAYREMYWKQVLELFSGDYGKSFELWFDGANGGDGWYGGACERRKIPENYYDFQGLISEVKKRQPDVTVFYDWDEGDLHYPGNESGLLHPDARGSFPTRAQAPTPGWENCLNRGDVNGLLFKQPECDVPLRIGWFYHREHDGCVRSPELLMKIYLRTVGNGGTMNVGIAPDRRGLVCDEDAKALAAFGELKKTFFSQKVDAPDRLFNVVVLREDVSRGEQVDGWTLELDGKCLMSGRSIGVKRIRLLESPVKGRDLKVRVTAAAGETRVLGPERYFVDPGLVARVLAAREPARPAERFADVGIPTRRTDRSLVFMFKNDRQIGGVTVSPGTSDVSGLPMEFSLSFSKDGETWSEELTGFRLDNIAANPIPQTLTLSEVRTARYVRLTATRLVDETATMGAIGLSVSKSESRR